MSRSVSCVRTAVASALAGLLLVGCGLLGEPTVSPATLAAEAERYDGRDIRTSGYVRVFDEDDGALERHHVLEDADANRVQLLPDEAAEPYVGQLVRVRGRFSFDERSGRALEVTEIEPAR